MSILKSETTTLPVRPYRMVGDPNETITADLTLVDAGDADCLALTVTFKEPKTATGITDMVVAQAWYDDLTDVRNQVVIERNPYARKFVYSPVVVPNSFQILVARRLEKSAKTCSEIIKLVRMEPLLEMSYKQRLAYRNGNRYFASPSSFKRDHQIGSDETSLTSSLEYLRDDNAGPSGDRLAIQFTPMCRSKLIDYFYHMAKPVLPRHDIPEPDYILVRYDKTARYIQCVSNPMAGGQRNPAFDRFVNQKSYLARIEMLSSGLFDLLVREYKTGYDNFYHRPSLPLYRISGTDW